MDAVVFVFKVDNKTINLYDSDAVSVISNLAKVKSFEMPKTDMSIRTVPLTEHTTTLLHEYKIHLNNVYPVMEDMYVFPADSSPYEPHNPSYITKHMKKHPICQI